ncbi:MAG: hypothetical protein L0K42_08575, partial [Acidipropionibacterium jensenii]|nr:hypothetical protein [Acidipropionibacterium jensenii]MDN6427740.1 hypothetical protein [Acidipropionibacterium jensenii]MDN6480762.1 hypothetical protein [Acidipropionibacterium jensenii]MDN6592770.1 hypothetical protein [Acidipropionibacterium jensenii]MDN6793043.1 hypothetical protein [Acidipropionibacterium jensenii]
GATLSPGAGAPAASAPDTSARAGTSAPGGPSGSVAMPSSADPEASTLRDFAIRNGPEQLPLPADLMISYTVDNPNNVTLVIDVSQGSQTYRFLRDRLPGAGFTITADRQQSLTFSGHGWSGAYTVSQDLAGLTLRRP